MLLLALLGISCGPVHYRAGSMAVNRCGMPGFYSANPDEVTHLACVLGELTE